MIKKSFLLIGLLIIGLFYFGFKSPLVVQIDNANFNTQDNSLSWAWSKNYRGAGECFTFSGELSGIQSGTTRIQDYLISHEIDQDKSVITVTGSLIYTIESWNLWQSGVGGVQELVWVSGDEDKFLNPPQTFSGKAIKEIADVGVVYLCVVAPETYGSSSNPTTINAKVVFKPNAGDIVTTTESLTQANVTSTTITSQPISFTTKTAIEQRQEGFFSWLWIKLKALLGI